MKRKFVLLVLALISVFCVAGAQTFNDYVLSMKGDTAVVKDYNDKNEASTLTSALNLDTLNVPAGRVYMLKKNGYYPGLTSPTSSATRPVVIVGEDFTRLVQNKNANSAPPLLCGFRNTGGNNTGGFNIGSTLTIKNCNIIPAISDGSLGWAYFGTTAADQKLVLENDLFERTRWVEIQSNSWPGLKMYILDCYFVNLIGQPCRRNGGVYDNVNNNTDTIWVENTTHVMAQGSVYKFRNYQIKKAFFNHNTFIDCAGSIFESLGYLSDLTVTNNIFVNSNVQPFCDSLGVADAGETDADMLPTGLINVDTLTASMTQMPRKVLVDKNVVYWDPKFNDMVATLKANNVNKTQVWSSQAITMNTRTQALFNDNTHYPYLTEGTWFQKLPAFTDPKDLLTTWVDSVKAFAMKTVDINGLGSAAVLSEWRKVNIIEPDNYIYSDWPIPENLAYSDADLMAGGTNGFPVGDLNWFPARKTAWDAQKATEHTQLQYNLDHGTTAINEQPGTVPEVYALDQNYPNPFNPTTTISFSLPHASDVSLKVFNLLGQEVASLVSGNQTAGPHEVKFNAAGLASGVYFYKLVAGDFTQVKKMSLVK